MQCSEMSSCTDDDIGRFLSVVHEIKAILYASTFSNKVIQYFTGLLITLLTTL